MNINKKQFIGMVVISALSIADVAAVLWFLGWQTAIFMKAAPIWVLTVFLNQLILAMSKASEKPIIALKDGVLPEDLRKGVTRTAVSEEFLIRAFPILFLDIDLAIVLTATIIWSEFVVYGLITTSEALWIAKKDKALGRKFGLAMISYRGIVGSGMHLTCLSVGLAVPVMGPFIGTALHVFFNNRADALISLYMGKVWNDKNLFAKAQNMLLGETVREPTNEWKKSLSGTDTDL